MTQEKITIVITNYNQCHLIEQAINSAINQDYLEKEIIIVDDGSTDSSLEEIDNIAERLDKNHLITEVISKKNGGTASARNIGYRSCQSDIICFLDADDYYLPNKVSRSVQELRRYDFVGLVYSDYYEIMLNGTKKLIMKPPFAKKALLKECIISTNSTYLRKALDKIGGFDESLYKAEDYDSYLRIMNANYMIRHIPEPLFVYVNHGDNKTLTSNSRDWALEEHSFKQRAEQGIYAIT